MPLINSVEELMQRQGIDHWVVPHAVTGSLEQAARSAGIPLSRVARAVVLNDDQGPMLAILPLSHLVDFAALKQQLGRNLKPGKAGTANSSFYDCESGSVPPIASGYVCEVIVDESLKDFDTVYFEPGSHDQLIRVSGDDFVKLQGQYARWVRFARAQEQLVTDGGADELFVPGDSSAEPIDFSQLTPAEEIRKAIDRVYDLPAMPQMTQSLLKLQADPNAEIQDLADIVQLDPSLSAQVIRYARSPFFGFRGKIESIHDAITRVLGFDMVMHMAMGISAGQPFKNPPDGPLGLVEFWRHATYSAALAQSLVKHIPTSQGIKPGMAYLAGLLHNFGFLILGHLFQPEFFLLNKLVASNPNIPVTTLEQQIMGQGELKKQFNRGHPDMGAWLMESWKMPDEVVVSMREHHHAQYREDYWQYALLIQAVDHLLKQHHIGDADSEELPVSIFEALELDQTEALQVTERVLAECQQLDAMARQLAA